MSVMKYAHAEIQEPVLDRLHWEKMHGKRSPQGAAKFAASGRSVSSYCLSHCTILASVMCEDAPYDYLIKPESSHLVNNNQDAFENTVIKMSYKSFLGAFNFVEHYQNTKAKKSCTTQK